MQHRHSNALLPVLAAVLLLAGATTAQDGEYDPITSDDCAVCHETSDHDTVFAEDISHSAHEGLECLDCHTDRGTTPHREEKGFFVGCQGCRDCHGEASEQYTHHGRSSIGSCEDMPQCKDCHGDHDVLPSSVKISRTHPVNLPATCGRCHENTEITEKYDILIAHPIRIYEGSVHGKATKGGLYMAASCDDCHSTEGTSHRILGPGHPDSSINHFNIPDTCGVCHRGVLHDFNEGIHGKLVARGETDAPVCTHCHGEHGIIATDDPRSPVSRGRLAQETCSPCHESAVLNEKYGLASGRLITFLDSYHGLKSKAGDTHVANCASCHGVHRILPSSDPESTIHPANLQATCGDCHPGISEQLAATGIHGVSGEGLRTRAADIVEKIYIIAIVVIIGLMLLHWLIDLGRVIRNALVARPQVQRMRPNEVWQHTLLMLSFIALVVSGFALRFSESWISRLFFGWEGGFAARGQIHRGAAVVFLLVVLWHAIFLVASRRGRQFVRDMMPGPLDFAQFGRRILYNLGLRKTSPRFGRFSYVEKAEYWALAWGTGIMVVTGLLLWFDNWFIQFLPKGFLDVALVVHYWEAWLATLAIVVWHLYSTVFSPSVYPMNPSWITGAMPEQMYRHEHPEHLEQAKRESAEYLRGRMRRLAEEEPETSEEEAAAEQDVPAGEDVPKDPADA